MAAEGNCAVVTPGGEQPEAEVRLQTGLPRPVNSIRCLRRASLLATERSLPHSRRTTDGREPVDAGPCLRRYSWSGNARKGSGMKIRELPWCQEESMAEVRASIVAIKRGNARGAKGRRKTKRTNPCRGYNIANIAARLPLAKLSNLRDTEDSLEATLVTGCLDHKTVRRQSFLWPCRRTWNLPLDEGNSSIGEPDAGRVIRKGWCRQILYPGNAGGDGFFLSRHSRHGRRTWAMFHGQNSANSSQFPIRNRMRPSSFVRPS